MSNLIANQENCLNCINSVAKQQKQLQFQSDLISHCCTNIRENWSFIDLWFVCDLIIWICLMRDFMLLILNLRTRMFYLYFFGNYINSFYGSPIFLKLGTLMPSEEITGRPQIWNSKLLPPWHLRKVTKFPDRCKMLRRPRSKSKAFSFRGCLNIRKTLKGQGMEVRNPCPCRDVTEIRKYVAASAHIHFCRFQLREFGIFTICKCVVTSQVSNFHSYSFESKL